ncbi:uncharacterized protein N7484_004027 [Penicillium longicatenatum]|uniref:uncharacterized protein n=1 Tax=Penicillium longicatenatum TaxID=1561947 RepID=UPI0025489840|nr:uncharacterized protein N7484_004027 [Penicillium longicatenatum]KAJ5650304.1 hypothetical protein N7484_004027 [Penicillium longicatenatum]
MKVILTGSTGFVGREILNQCLAHPAITSVVALSRRELPQHDKLKVAVIEDFLSYPESVRKDITGAEACIWTIGLIPSKVPKPDDGTAKRVSIEYTLAAARVFQEVCQKPFRFVYVSGAGTERDQSKSLWVMQDYRRIRGQVETELLDFAGAHGDFKPYIMRPAMIISREMSLRSLIFGLGPSVKVDVLAEYMIELALKGGDKAIWENADMK